MESTKSNQSGKMKILWIELVIRTILIILVVILVFTKILMIGQVSGMDMFPAVKDGDAFLAFRLNRDYERDDVVIYTCDGVTRIGRIVGLPGDTIELKGDGILRVNGAVQEGEIAFKTFSPTEEAMTCLVSEDSFYILGDYRTQAQDSRVYGEIHESSVQGKIITVLRRQSI